MAPESTAPTAGAFIARQRFVILGVLLTLAVLGWVVVVRQSRRGDDMAMGVTMGMSAAHFLAMWVATMVAMMVPTAAPMILTFAQVQAGKRRQARPFVPTWIFVAAYLAIWIVFGVAAYLLAIGADRLAERSMWLMDNAARFGGVTLLLAGLYQLSPLKRVCLTRCRTPLQFIMTSWRDGYRGAVRMGLLHGLYCLGCCWLLFVILFPLGIMNIAAMVLITVLIFAEKSLAISRAAQLAAGGALIAYGALVLLVPGALLTTL
jgi:predicted metal-binding membrane protein